jgi:hypothetical protein
MIQGKLLGDAGQTYANAAMVAGRKGGGRKFD